MGKYKGKSKVKKFYAVRRGRIPGMYYNWWDCKAQTDGMRGAEFAMFENEAEAEEFLRRPDVFAQIAAWEASLSQSVQSGGVTEPTQSSWGTSFSQASASSSQASASSSQASPSSYQNQQPSIPHQRIQQSLRREQDIAAANDRMRTLGVGDSMTIIRSASGFNFDVTRFAPPTPGPSHFASAISPPSVLNSNDITPSTGSSSADNDSDPLSDFE